MMNKTSLTFIRTAALIIAVSLGVLFATSFFTEEARQERAAERYLNDIEEQYANDTYGGATPEETLELFVAALEAGDIELASKYFVIEKQPEWLEKLRSIKENGLLGEMLVDLEKIQKDKIDSGIARYFLISENNLASPVVLVKESSGLWKIRTL